MRQKDYMSVALAARKRPAATGWPYFARRERSHPASACFFGCRLSGDLRHCTIFFEPRGIRPALLKFLRAWKDFFSRLGWASRIRQRAAGVATPSQGQHAERLLAFGSRPARTFFRALAGSYATPCCACFRG